MNQTDEPSRSKKRARRTGHGGAREGAGRKKGIPNRSTLAFRNYVREFTDEAVLLHVDVMRNVS
jgi:hypothetical protein